MLLTLSKTMFLSMLIISSLIVINSNNWLSMWMGMEMNLMAFIPLISTFNNKKSSQSMIIYFLIQSISSILLLFSIMMNSSMKISPIFMDNIIMTVVNMSLLIKMGAAPLHYWLPKMINNMKWKYIYMLMTWQKLAPIYMLSNMKMEMVIYLSIIMSSIAGAMGGMNTTSLRKIMTYSSINHLSWMLLMVTVQSQWYKYLLIYSIMTLMTILFFNHYNAYSINQLMNKMPTMLEKYTYSSLLLSMGGLPPFLGFLPKWMVIESTINSSPAILLILLIMSLITLFYYIRLISSMMLIYSTNNKWIMKYKMNSGLMYMNLMLPTMYIFSFM